MKHLKELTRRKVTHDALHAKAAQDAGRGGAGSLRGALGIAGALAEGIFIPARSHNTAIMGLVTPFRAARAAKHYGETKIYFLAAWSCSHNLCVLSFPLPLIHHVQDSKSLSSRIVMCPLTCSFLFPSPSTTSRPCPGWWWRGSGPSVAAVTALLPSHFLLQAAS